MASVPEIADRLEHLEAAQASPAALSRVLQEVEDPETLWQLADRLAAYPGLMEALYGRAKEIGGSEETARGYLALAYLFDGQQEIPAALVRDYEAKSKDPVLLHAWAELAQDRTEVLARLKESLKRCPESLRLWRQMATEALRQNARSEAREAHRWLAAHERTEPERDRIQAILRENGW